MTKLVETTSDVLPTLNKKNVAFPPQPPPCNVAPQLLPVENNKTSVCDKHDSGITCMIVNPHLTLLCSGPLRKYLFKGRWSLAEIFFKQNFCHGCHTRFAILLCSTILLHIQKFSTVWYYTECTSKYQETQSSSHATHLLTERDCSETTNMFLTVSITGKKRSLV